MNKRASPPLSLPEMPKALHRLRQSRRLVRDFQPLQRADHLLAAGQLRPARIGAEFALTAEPHHDDAGQDAQHELRGDRRDPVTDAWASPDRS